MSQCSFVNAFMSWTFQMMFRPTPWSAISGSASAVMQAFKFRHLRFRWWMGQALRPVQLHGLGGICDCDPLVGDLC